MLDMFIDLANSSVRMATPLMFAGLGGILSERAGVMNISLEGHMLTGAFFAMLVSFYTGSTWCGTLAAGIAGLLLAVILAVVCVSLNANQIVAGTAVNIIAVGLTSFLLKLFNIKQASTGVVTVNSFSEVPFGPLHDIPVIGPLLFSYKPLTYLAFVLVAVLAVYFNRTKIGLVHKSVGENPQAADTLGISVRKVRYLAVLGCGFLCGVGGAVLSVSQLNQFQDEMVAGKGFIAFAAIIFGKWTPRGMMLAALLFGAADAIQMRVQASGIGISYHLLQMLPYLITMVALAGIIGKTVPPAADGYPYNKEDH